MFNADGSEAEMCGNGIRCVAKYVYDHGIAKKTRLTIETGRGVLTLDLEVADGKVEPRTRRHGRADPEAAKIPTTLAGERVVNAPLPDRCAESHMLGRLAGGVRARRRG